jgi:hypothetical protein
MILIGEARACCDVGQTPPTMSNRFDRALQAKMT